MHAKSLADALRPLAALADAFDAGRIEMDHCTTATPAETPAEAELYTGRGGTRLLTLQDAITARSALETGTGLDEAAVPLMSISRAWCANKLDDEARKFIGPGAGTLNPTPPADAPLVTSTGGAMLLSLGDALAAHYALLEHRNAQRATA